MTKQNEDLFALAIGACVMIALGAVFSTLAFIFSVWVNSEGGQSVQEGYLAVRESYLYTVLNTGSGLAAYLIGGWTAALLSRFLPYRNAALAAVIVLGWYLMIKASMGSPPGLATSEILNFVMPVPVALLGATLFLRKRNG